MEERPDFRTSFVVSKDVKDKITHESSVGDLSAQINSEDSDSEQAENLNILVIDQECESSLYASAYFIILGIFVKHFTWQYF